MWAVMEKAEPSVFVRGNAEGEFSSFFFFLCVFDRNEIHENLNWTGVERVKRSGRMYAYFMESAPLKYITHRECNLTQVGGLLDSKEYAIGMPVSKSSNFWNSQLFPLKHDDYWN